MMETSDLIYGRNKLDRIVSIETGDSTAEVFRELEDGSIVTQTVPCSHYILYTQRHSDKFKRLEGDQPFRWMYECDSRAKFSDVLAASYKKRWDLHVVRDPKEAIMIKDGYTLFKGMKVEDVSVLSFDIETTGLVHDASSSVLLISNSLRKKGKIIRKLFSLDEFQSQADMLKSWCAWVIEMNPSIVIGHNIFGYDLPYMNFVANRNGVKLILGRDCSEIRFAHRTSQFRKDGSQTYDYTNALIYGREIVDTYFLSIKYDIGRNYESYGLKPIIKHEGLERKGRTHYDASKIKDDWHDLEKRKQIKEYAIDDADDALKLYELMIPSLFYYTQSVPRGLQQIVNSATGSQVNSLMVRGYLQQGHSIAMGSPAVEYQGAISFAKPGLHKNCFKIDCVSLYPSIIRQWKLYDRKKDPQGLFLEMVNYFTVERIKNKNLAKQTGERFYKDLEQSMKIQINSAYGFLGAPKLNYNSPENAALVTTYGREILKHAINWASGENYVSADRSTS